MYFWTFLALSSQNCPSENTATLLHLSLNTVNNFSEDFPLRIEKIRLWYLPERSGIYTDLVLAKFGVKLQRESKWPGTGRGEIVTGRTGSPSLKCEHRQALALLHNNQNIGICMGKKPIVSVSYKNERISIKKSLPYIKWVLHLSCVQVHGPIYGCLWVVVSTVLSIYVRFTKVGDSSKAARWIHRRKTAVNSLQRLQLPPNSA